MSHTRAHTRVPTHTQAQKYPHPHTQTLTDPQHRHSHKQTHTLPQNRGIFSGNQATVKGNQNDKLEQLPHITDMNGNVTFEFEAFNRVTEITKALRPD